MNPSSRATKQNSGSLCASLTALILPVNSSIVASGGDRKPAGPDSAKPGFLDDAGTQCIVSLHQKLKTSGLQELLELLRLTDFASARRGHDARRPKDTNN